MLPQTLRAAPTPLILACAFFFGAAYFVVRFPDVPGASAASYLSTLAIALPSLVALWTYFGARRTILALISLSLFAYALEAFGVTTGLPYGAFEYDDSLGPKLFGLVPYILPVSYVPLVIGSVAATRGSRIVSWPLRSAALLTLMDGVLDPGATFLGFWTWPEGGAYYGVPLSNYLGWLISGALASALLILAGRSVWRKKAPLPGLLDSSIIALAFWSGVALFSGLIFPAMLGALLFAFLLRRRSRLRSAVARRV